MRTDEYGLDKLYVKNESLKAIPQDEDSWSKKYGLSPQNRRLPERFQPGYTMVQRSKEQVCKHLLPVIPVRMLEAWMLVDHEALRNLLKTRVSARDLGLPEKAKQVETYQDPKGTLRQIVRKAYPNQPKQWNRITRALYDDLGFSSAWRD